MDKILTTLLYFLTFLNTKIQSAKQRCSTLNRSLFSNFSIDNILSENLAGEENVKLVDVNVLTKIKQEKIELLGESLFMK